MYENLLESSIFFLRISSYFFASLSSSLWDSHLISSRRHVLESIDVGKYIKRLICTNGKIPRDDTATHAQGFRGGVHLLRKASVENKIRGILRHLSSRSMASHPGDTRVQAENRVKVKVNRSLLLSKGQDVYMHGAEWRHYNKWRWFYRKRKKKEVLRADRAHCFNSWKNLITATIHLTVALIHS